MGLRKDDVMLCECVERTQVQLFPHPAPGPVGTGKLAGQQGWRIQYQTAFPGGKTRRSGNSEFLCCESWLAMAFANNQLWVEVGTSKASTNVLYPTPHPGQKTAMVTLRPGFGQPNTLVPDRADKDSGALALPMGG